MKSNHVYVPSENKSSRVWYFWHKIYINQMFMLYILQIFYKNNYSKNDNTGLLFGICQINLFSGFLIMCLNNLSNKYNHFMTYHQKKIKTAKQFFQMILFILLREIVLINWVCWKLLDFNLFIVVLILFCIRGFIYFSVGIIRRMTPWSAVYYFYFVTIKKLFVYFNSFSTVNVLFSSQWFGTFLRK